MQCKRCQASKRTLFTAQLFLSFKCVSKRYTIYKLSAGAYFKYSSDGTPVLLFALGYGTEGKNDVGDTYTFVLGDRKALPVAATLGLVGLRTGGAQAAHRLTWRTGKRLCGLHCTCDSQFAIEGACDDACCVAGRRRVLVPPQLGWAREDGVGPPPDTFGAQRRLANNRDAPLLFEAELVRVTDVGEPGFDVAEYEQVKLKSPYSLPVPPRYGESSRGS
jgi:hypothetical protein